MTTAAKASNSAIQPYTDGTCLILKRVRFANGELYDVRIRKNGQDGESIAFGKIASSTLSQVQKAVVVMFKHIVDPNPVSIRYTRKPEACVLTNKMLENPEIDLMTRDAPKGHCDVVDQARKIYQYLLPQNRAAISLDPNAQLVKDPIQISAKEVDQWNHRKYQKETPIPSAPELDEIPPVSERVQTHPATKTTPLPESTAQASAPTPVKPAPSQRDLKRLLFASLDAVPFNYSGQEIKYTDLCKYYLLSAEKRKNHSLSPFSDALQQVFRSPDGDGDREIRKWIFDLYQVAYKFYSKYTKYNEPACRENAARVVVTFSSGVDINPYYQKLMSSEIPLVIQIGSTDISVESGDITQATGVEAIVNAANRQCLGGTGVDGAIHKAAGKKLREECMKLTEDEEGNRCDTGCAVITGSGDLKKRGIDHVIHAVGPDCREVSPEEAEELLRETYLSALEEANLNEVRSVAFPAISTGVYGYPFEDATRVALETVEAYSRQNPGHFDKIKLIFLPGKDYSRAAKVFNSIHDRK